jgi:uncharacterized membrane protein YhaH (DUF805 family)
MFLTLFLLQCSLIVAVSHIVHSPIVVFPLALFLFFKLFRARLSSVFKGRAVAITAAVIVSLHLTQILMIDHTYLFYIPPEFLYHNMMITHFPQFIRIMQLVISAVFVILSSLSLAAIVIMTVFPRTSNEWRSWAVRNISPLLSFSGKIGRIPFLIVTLIIQLLFAVALCAALVLTFFVSRGDLNDLFAYNKTAGVICLVILGLIVIVAYIAILGAVMRRLRDLGRSIPALILYIALSVLFVAFNPFLTIAYPRLFYYLSGMSYGMIITQYCAPIIGIIGFSVRILWAGMIFYIALYPGSEKDHL